LSRGELFYECRNYHWFGFQEHYPEWKIRHGVPDILREIYELNVERWRGECVMQEKETSSAF
jgi:hypothetical protein